MFLTTEFISEDSPTLLIDLVVPTAYIAPEFYWIDLLIMDFWFNLSFSFCFLLVGEALKAIPQQGQKFPAQPSS